MPITYNGSIIQIVEHDVDIGGWKIKTFERARRAPGVRILLINDKQEILVTKEFRYELDAYDWRLPGGKVFDTLQEYVAFLHSWEDIESHVLTAAMREWKEEVGIAIWDQEILCKKICGATIERDLWYVLVKDFSWLDAWTSYEEGELIEGYERFSFQQIRNMLAAWEIQEWRTAAVLAEIVLS